MSEMNEYLRSNYRSGVRVGRWLEDLTLEEAEREKFTEQYQAGCTKLQNTRRMKANLLKEINLAVADSMVVMGSIVQVVNPDMPAFRNTAKKGHFGVFLAGYVNDTDVDRCQHLYDGSQVNGSPMAEPCVRNSWRLCAADGSRDLDGSPLQLGQPFSLAAVESGTRCPLYVRAVSANTTSLGIRPAHATVELSTHADRFIKWRALHLDKNKRFETQGNTFSPNMRIVIQHVASELNLAVEANHWFGTFFGLECALRLHDYKDIYRQVKCENVWMLAVRRPRDPRDERDCPCPRGATISSSAPRPADRLPESAATRPEPRACPDFRKTPCPGDMPCLADVPFGRPPPTPSGGLLPRMPPDPRLKPCPRDPPCPGECPHTSRSSPAYPNPTQCLRNDAALAQAHEYRTNEFSQ